MRLRVIVKYARNFRVNMGGYNMVKMKVLNMIAYFDEVNREITIRDEYGLVELTPNPMLIDRWLQVFKEKGITLKEVDGEVDRLKNKAPEEI